LEVDDVVSKLVVLGLDGFVILVQNGVVSNLFLELLDVSLFTLSEGSLYQEREKRQRAIECVRPFCEISRVTV